MSLTESTTHVTREMPIHRDSTKMGNRNIRTRENKRASRHPRRYTASELSLQHHLEPTSKGFDTPREPDQHPPPYDDMYPNMIRSSPDGSEDMPKDRGNREGGNEEETTEGRNLGNQVKQKISGLGLSEAKQMFERVADLTQGARESFR